MFSYDLKFFRTENSEPIFYTDSDFADSILQDGMKSISNYVGYLVDVPIIWFLKCQTTTTTSNTEAEYIGQFNVMKYMVYISHFLTELSILYNTSMTLFTDNQDVQATVRNPKYYSRLKHVVITYHY